MKIVVTLDGKKIKEYALDREIDKDSGSEIILWIGRSKSCFIILEKSQISREHAKLWYTDGHWKIQGLDSIRSIQVNGESVESALLKPDDIINIAPYTLKVSGDLSKDNFDVAEKNEEEKLEDHTDKQSKPIEDIEDIQEDGNEEEEKYSLKDTQNPEEEEYSLKDTQNAEETENDGESNGIASESFLMKKSLIKKNMRVRTYPLRVSIQKGIVTKKDLKRNMQWRQLTMRPEKKRRSFHHFRNLF